jgi:hypothetical protein
MSLEELKPRMLGIEHLHEKQGKAEPLTDKNILNGQRRIQI